MNKYPIICPNCNDRLKIRPAVFQNMINHRTSFSYGLAECCNEIIRINLTLDFTAVKSDVHLEEDSWGYKREEHHSPNS